MKPQRLSRPRATRSSQLTKGVEVNIGPQYLGGFCLYVVLRDAGSGRRRAPPPGSQPREAVLHVMGRAQMRCGRATSLRLPARAAGDGGNPR